jgi:hypothetical protein
MLGGIDTWVGAGYDYWVNENETSIDFILPVFLVSLTGVIFVLVLFSKRRGKVVKPY